MLDVFDQSDHSDHWRSVNGFTVIFIIKADVA